MKRLTRGLAFAVLAFAGVTYGEGISVDTGITPAEDRWIARTMVHYMARGNDQTEMGRRMETYVVPLVIAYGVRSDLTLIGKLPFKWQVMQMMGETTRESGVGDLTLIAKYKLYRRNRADSVIGIAPTLAVELPTGSEPFSSDTWNVTMGGYGSWVSGPFSCDVNLAYKINDLPHQWSTDTDLGDEVTLDIAVAYQFDAAADGAAALMPVLEFSFLHAGRDKEDGADVSDSGEWVLHLSPGLKYIRSNLMVEALLQVPVAQDQNGNMLEREIGGLFGVRHMF